jgi:flagellar assembly protein FliH
MILSYNLLKHQFVYSEQSAARIINSNDKMEEKMKELVRIYQNAGIDSQGDSVNREFVDGILADNVEGDDVAVETGQEGSPVIHKADWSEDSRELSDKIVADAEAEANRILEDAKSRADQMVIDANAKAQELYEAQKDIGYKDGEAACEREMNRKIAELEAQNTSLQQELEVEYQQKLGTMETDLVDAITQVFNKVFHIQFEDKRDILLHLIRRTLYSVEPEKHYRILVSDENWQYVEARLSELSGQLGSDVELEVTRDPKMTNSECRIETENAVYDCSIDQELDGLCRDIRSLCS